MWGTGINRPRIPLKCLPTVLSLSPDSIPLCQRGGNGCLLTCALAWHYDEHSLWLPVPPRKLRIILISILSPSFSSLSASGWRWSLQFCHVSVLTLLVLLYFIAHRNPSTCQAISSPSVPIIPLHPSPSLSLALGCYVLRSLFKPWGQNKASTVTLWRPLLRVIPVHMFTFDVYNPRQSL